MNMYDFSHEKEIRMVKHTHTHTKFDMKDVLQYI